MRRIPFYPSIKIADVSRRFSYIRSLAGHKNPCVAIGMRAPLRGRSPVFHSRKPLEFLTADLFTWYLRFGRCRAAPRASIPILLLAILGRFLLVNNMLPSVWLRGNAISRLSLFQQRTVHSRSKFEVVIFWKRNTGVLGSGGCRGSTADISHQACVPTFPKPEGCE